MKTTSLIEKVDIIRCQNPKKALGFDPKNFENSTRKMYFFHDTHASLIIPYFPKIWSISQIIIIQNLENFPTKHYYIVIAPHQFYLNY